MTSEEQGEALPPEPGHMQDLTCGLASLPEGTPNPAPYDTSTEDEPAEANDYDDFPDGEDDGEDD